MDKAILRPGRFDKIIEVGLPDKKGRFDILGKYLKEIKHKKIQSLEDLSKRTIGFSPADLKNLINIAALNAVKNN